MSMRMRRRTPTQPWSRSQASASFHALPLPRYRQQNSQFPLTGRGGRGLNGELFDKQERHSGFEIVDQRLQCRLIDFAAREHADKSRLGLRALQIELG